MKLRALALVPLLLWTCATPPPVTTPAPPPTPLAMGPDDDHRSVAKEDFGRSPWAALPPATSWKAGPTGIAVSLADGRVLRLEFAAPAVVRWWVPAAPGDQPLAPGAVYPVPATTVKTKEVDGVVFLDTPGLGVRFRLDDLSWTLVRGDRAVLHTVGGPRAAGRRLNQAFDGRDAVTWTGPGLTAAAPWAKFWVDGQPNPEGTGPWATPALVGAGGVVPFVVALDNSYQTYSRVTAAEATLGSLNGGLDLLVAAAPQPGAVVEALTEITGRPGVPPLWAHGTALVLPAAETGAFLRKAKVSIQTAAGPANPARPRFQSLTLAPGKGPLPDLTLTATREAWTAALGLPDLTPGAGLALAPAAGRHDWEARFDDGGLGSPLARMNNRLPGLEAQAVGQVWEARNPGLRPMILAGAAGWGTVRQALPEVKVVAGSDEGDLARVLVAGAAGLGTPAIRLDLTPLAAPETRAAAFQSLVAWSLAPVLTLDWGPDPAAFWAGLTDADRQRLKAILDRRSQFKPLLAQTARVANATGKPAWQPLWFAGPTDPLTLARNDEFLFGDGLLVAPASGGAATRPVYLPGPGVWFDFWSGEEFGGGRTYDIDVRADKPLLFARGGAVVPVREAEAFDEKDVYNPLTVHVFPGGRGVGTYYLDDGRTLAWRGGASWETKLIYDFEQKDMTLEHQTVKTTGALRPDPYLLYRLHNVFKPKQVKIDGKPIPLYGDSWGITDTDRSAAWYEGDHTLLIKTFRPERDQTIVMSF